MTAEVGIRRLFRLVDELEEIIPKETLARILLEESTNVDENVAVEWARETLVESGWKPPAH